MNDFGQSYKCTIKKPTKTKNTQFEDNTLENEKRIRQKIETVLNKKASRFKKVYIFVRKTFG